MELSIWYFKGLLAKISIKCQFTVAEDSILANSADTDEMLPKVAFHLGLHCLQSTCLPVSRMKRHNTAKASFSCALS